MYEITDLTGNKFFGTYEDLLTAGKRLIELLRNEYKHNRWLTKYIVIDTNTGEIML